MAVKERYPIGEQDFKSLREGDYLYIDKTRYVDMIVKGSKYYFLARPRRFGKSLFLSTLRYFFEGRRELFKDLYIDSTDWIWESYPVFRLDLNINKYADPEALDAVLDNLFNKWETKYNVGGKSLEMSVRFRDIIEAAHEKTGKQVVILVDEYDKPLVGNLNNDENFDHYRSKLASLYSNFKSSAEHIRLVFLTGVSRFSKLSVFSDLNNIRDITFANEYADICGISEQELKRSFKGGIETLSRKYGWNHHSTLRHLKENYDGYRFAEEGSDMYNPWSLLNAMEEEKIANYWNRTGLPTLIIESLKRIKCDLEQFLCSQCSLDELEGLDLTNPRPLALLYQTGYLTIKGYDPEFSIYQLGIPNNEVRQGLMTHLLSFYSSLNGTETNFFVGSFVRDLRKGDVENFMTRLKSFFAATPYDMDMGNERNFHNAIYVLMTLVGLYVKAEVKTSSGRIDILCQTNQYIYVIEIKYDGTAREALDQIEHKGYTIPFKSDGRHIICIGTNYSSKERRITDWLIAKES